MDREDGRLNAPAPGPPAPDWHAPRTLVLPAMASGDLELRVMDGGMRWKLQPTAAVEIWRGATPLGTLSGTALCLLVDHHLAAAALAATIQAELAAAPITAAPLPAPPRSPHLVLAPPAARPGPVTAEQKAALRARRRARRR